MVLLNFCSLCSFSVERVAVRRKESAERFSFAGGATVVSSCPSAFQFFISLLKTLACPIWAIIVQYVLAFASCCMHAYASINLCVRDQLVIQVLYMFFGR